MEPKHPRINPDRDREKYLFLDDTVVVTLSNGDTITIEKGFKFDGHSVPRFLWCIFPPYDCDVYAALVHDALCSGQFSPFKQYTRKFIDMEYMRFMQEYKATDARSFWMPLGVRVSGFIRYDMRGK